MSVRKRLLAGLLLASAVLSAGSFSVGSTAAAQQPMVSVAMVDDPLPQDQWGYDPSTATVPVGGWVVWSNAGSEVHTVTADDLSFDSGDKNPSEGFSFQFQTPGTYTYYCIEHPWMKGTVVVTQ